MEVVSKKEAYGFLLKWLIKAGDLILINIFFVFLYRYLKSTGGEYSFFFPHRLSEMFLLVNLSYFITSSIISIEISSNIIFFDKIIQRAFSFITLYIIILTSGMSLFKIMNVSWVLFIVVYLTLVVAYLLWHILFRIVLKIYRRKGHNYKTVIIVGGGVNGLSVYNELSASEYGFKVLGFFDDNLMAKNIMPNYLGGTSKVEQFCAKNKVDELYCTLPGNQEGKIIQLFNFAENNLIRFYLVPEFYKYIRRRLLLNFLHSTPIIAVRKEPLQALSNRLLKRSFDVAFSFLALVTVFPVLYIVFGAIIKLTSSGPVFFKQRRTGLKGELFYCYKFRSMKLNQEADKLATTKCDPRVTPIGAFMRKTSIDEMPQFINVLIGNMSIVGPRPHMNQQTELYVGLIDKFMVRHLIKPGITGWAQISGYRGETSTIDKMELRFKADVWYLENWTFLLDIKIIAVTVINLFRGEDNAY